MPSRKTTGDARPPGRSEKPTRAGKPTSLVPTDPLRQYLAILRQFPTLTPEEEKSLTMRYRLKKDREALARIVTGNLRLVVRIALDLQRAYSHLLDLIQEGNIGLLMAIHRFDPYKGTRLSTYATWWIRAYIIKYILDNWSIVRVGTTNLRRKLFFNLKRERERLEKMGFEPGPKLLAETFGATEQDVIDVSSAINARDVSLDAPRRFDETSSFVDLVPSREPSQEDRVVQEETREIVRERLAEFARKLNKRELLVFRERITAEEPATLQDLADRMGITREGVRQIEKRIKERLKAWFEKDPRLHRENRPR